MVSTILFLSFFVMLILNVPIAISLGMSVVLSLLATNSGMAMVASNYYAATSKFVLLAIPFFILGGSIMEKAGISVRLINLAKCLVGHKRNGLGMVCVIVACFFAAISGSGPATVAALGMIVIPAMIDVGYPRETSSALMATAGAIGVIIPPSISFVIYGSIANVSISKLFIAGIIPGCLMGFALVIVCIIITKNVDLRQEPKCSIAECIAAFKDAVWGLLMPVIILGGIYGGIFTPTEAAAVAAVYGLFVGMFVYHTIQLKDLKELFAGAVSQTAVVMLVSATANLFSWLITTEGIADLASNFIYSISAGNWIIFMLLVNIMLLIAGCFLDGSAAFYLFTPILLPVALKLGYDPLVLGVVMTVNLAIGMVTPPVGVNLYVACGIGKINIRQITKAVLPFIGGALVVLVMITYIPQISQLLPGFLK